MGRIDATYKCRLCGKEYVDWEEFERLAVHSAP